MIAILRRTITVAVLLAAPLLAGCAMFNGEADSKSKGGNAPVAKVATKNKQPATDRFPTAPEAGL